jgi:hypothetical protein
VKLLDGFTSPEIAQVYSQGLSVIGLDAASAETALNVSTHVNTIAASLMSARGGKLLPLD